MTRCRLYTTSLWYLSRLYVQFYQGCFWHYNLDDICRLFMTSLWFYQGYTLKCIKAVSDTLLAMINAVYLWQDFDIYQGYTLKCIKAVSDTVFDMINAVYLWQAFDFYQEKLVSHHGAVNEDDSCLLIGSVGSKAVTCDTSVDWHFIGRCTEFIKAIFDTVLNMIHATYPRKPLVFIGAAFRGKLVSHHRLINEDDSCLLMKAFLRINSCLQNRQPII